VTHGLAVEDLSTTSTKEIEDYPTNPPNYLSFPGGTPGNASLYDYAEQAILPAPADAPRDLSAPKWAITISIGYTSILANFISIQVSS
jgi:hypothetical protein